MTASETSSDAANRRPARLGVDEVARQISASPFRQWLGLELKSVDDEWVVLSARWREEMIGNARHGVVQGGVQAGMIDLACVYAMVAAYGRPAPTLTLSIDYHRPAAGRGDFTVRARVVHGGRTIATVEGFLYDDGGELLSSGRGTFFPGVDDQRRDAASKP